MTQTSRIDEMADQVIGRVGLLKNPYLVQLCDGALSLRQFQVSQQQFYFAVRYFSRPIAVLMSRIPDPVLRLGLLHNIVEEHGEFREPCFHQNTFAQFLGSIGADSPGSTNVSMEPVVHAFNCILMAACHDEEVAVGVSCLGIIEKAFATISRIIGEGVVARGWVRSDRLVHYTLHAELDVRHADDMFAIVEPRMADAVGQNQIKQGLELGAYAFDQLYRGLLLQPQSYD